MAEDNGLLAIIREARIRGKSYLEIERLYNIPAARAEAIMAEHYANKLTGIDLNEYRMLQLERLESLIDPLFSMAQMGNVKSAEALIKNLEGISNLLALNLEQEKKAIQVMTDEQATLIFSMVTMSMKLVLDNYVSKFVPDQRQLAVLEDGLDDALANSFEIVTAELITEPVDD